MAHPELHIRTPSLVIRQFAPRDAEAVYVLSKEGAYRTWLPSQVYESLEEASSVLQHLIDQYEKSADPRKGPYVLAVDDRATGELIGHVGFSPLYEDVEIGFLDEDVEIGFAIGQDHQGKGLGAEAVEAASKWTFETFNLKRIFAIASSANHASKRTLERTRFTYEKDEVMEFQGTRQSVSIYVRSRES